MLVLLSLPLNYLMLDFDEGAILWGAPVFFVLVAVWALDNAFGARKGSGLHDAPGILRSLWHTYLYVAMFLPMAWYYFVGGIRALFGVYGDFHRTPKGTDEQRSAMPGINTVLLIGEILTFLYSFLAVCVAFRARNYVLIPLNLTVCVGFGMVLFWSWQERVAHARKR